VNALCETVRGRLPEYLEDGLSTEDRRTYREHIGSCEACRESVLEIEPSLVFARVRAEDVSSEDVERVLTGVRSGIALAEAERRAGRARNRGRHRVAAMASAAALSAMTLVLPGSRPAARRPAGPVAAAPSAPAAGFAPAAQTAPSGTFPAEATIYDWNPGAASEEPRVVWIVDRSLDI
jgi:anti-sigma factor RsiW